MLPFILLLLVCSTAGAIDNTELGDLQVAYIDATRGIPDTMCSTTDTTPHTSNLILGYNDTQSCVDIFKDSTLTGKVFVGGFIPATDTTYAINLGIVSQNYKNNIDIVFPHARVIVGRYENGDYRITSRYTDETNTSATTYFTVPAANITDDKITIKITSNSIDRTNFIECNGQSVTTAYYGTNIKNLSYTPVIAPMFWLAPYTIEGSEITTKIYSISQTIPQKTVTAIGYSNYTSYGLDYPRPDVNANGTEYMHNLGYRGTAWADVKYLGDVGYIDYTKLLIDDQDWELGVHFKGRLTDKSFEDACVDIDTEMMQMYNAFGRYPTSWCSLQNADNESHAAYIYEKYGALWRNGRAGIGYLASVGNIHSTTMTWWDEIYSRGIIYPAFSHQTDIDPAIAYSLTPAEFRSYIDGYNSKNINIVGYEEYYKRNLNQKDAVITIEQDSNSVFSYELATTGYPTNLHITPTLDGWATKSKGGIYESVINIESGYDFSEQSTGSYKIEKIPIDVTGAVSLNIKEWSENIKTWTLSSINQAETVTHTIGGLQENADIAIYRDGIYYDNTVSNSTGYITWVYDGGFSEHEFSIITGSDFSVTSVTGTVPFTVQFSNVTDSMSYTWDFENDGIVDSTKQNPVHVYGKAGKYTVNLTVQNEYGYFSNVKTDYITVSTPSFVSDPIAWFSWIMSYISSIFIGSQVVS